MSEQSRTIFFPEAVKSRLLALNQALAGLEAQRQQFVEGVLLGMNERITDVSIQVAPDWGGVTITPKAVAPGVTPPLPLHPEGVPSA